MELAGKTALVTGGSRGVGRAVSLRLAAAGARVVVNYCRNEAAARETCARIQAAGGAAEAVAADVGDPRAVRDLCDRLRARDVHLDVLVHSAALGRFQPMLSVRHAEWSAAFRTNAEALLLLARETRDLLVRPGGRIVAVSSLGSRRYVPFYGAIGASKAALESLVRSLAVELAPDGVRVNAVSGGLIEGETMRRLPGADVFRGRVSECTPAGRLGTAEELAEAILFLCSERSSWIYGQTLVVDGGFSLV